MQIGRGKEDTALLLYVRNGSMLRGEDKHAHRDTGPHQGQRASGKGQSVAVHYYCRSSLVDQQQSKNEKDAERRMQLATNMTTNSIAEYGEECVEDGCRRRVQGEVVESGT